MWKMQIKSHEFYFENMRLTPAVAGVARKRTIMQDNETISYMMEKWYL